MTTAFIGITLLWALGCFIMGMLLDSMTKLNGNELSVAQFSMALVFWPFYAAAALLALGIKELRKSDEEG